MLNVNNATEYSEKGPDCHLPPSSWGDQHLGMHTDDTLSVTSPQTALQYWAMAVILSHDLQTDSELKMQKYVANAVLQETT